MKTTKSIYFILLFTVLLGGCKKFLDKLPDNRTELNTVEKVRALLTTAYPQAPYQMGAELMSDNAEDKGVLNRAQLDQSFYTYKDFISDEGTQDSPTMVWSNCYGAIAAANAALDAIEKASNPEDYNAEKGEALVCRAFSHFLLVTLFAKPYNSSTSASDKGVPYVTKPEKVVFGQYSRGTVAEVYASIEKDLLAGMPLIDDKIYTVPKYHFTKVAANAFAARFFLFKKQYDKVIQYATAAFGNQEAFIQNMRPWISVYLKSTPAVVEALYSRADQNANLLLVECPSLWARKYYGSAFGYTSRLLQNSVSGFYTTINPAGVNPSRWVQRGFTYYRGSNPDNEFNPKWNEYFYAPDNPSYGLPYIMAPMLTVEEVLFNLAEAYIESEKYEMALNQLNIYVSQRVSSYNAANDNVTVAKAQTYANTTDTKEALIKSLLYLKRIEFIQEGMRWFDILRHEMPVLHTIVDVNKNVTDSINISATDSRRQWQIPQTAQTAGLEPNPRP